ncbi:hypothetical protein Hypma_014460 [Hypsizygus marmoreus]|uniref:Uncharacterized protein n=1 Tax=Hypsizygus marmoreus TaxID=39966 RepID=A0A369JA73_HYPMA|nr:hypothetical protein Hypma_014460 [Hypsizygus marmoreus]
MNKQRSSASENRRLPGRKNANFQLPSTYAGSRVMSNTITPAKFFVRQKKLGFSGARCDLNSPFSMAYGNLDIWHRPSNPRDHPALAESLGRLLVFALDVHVSPSFIPSQLIQHVLIYLSPHNATVAF